MKYLKSNLYLKRQIYQFKPVGGLDHWSQSEAWDNLSLQYIKAENTEMEINEEVETLGCKFIEYIISLTTLCNHVAASNHTACANPTRNTINAFSVLMQNNNTIV